MLPIGAATAAVAAATRAAATMDRENCIFVLFLFCCGLAGLVVFGFGCGVMAGDEGRPTEFPNRYKVLQRCEVQKLSEENVEPADCAIKVERTEVEWNGRK